MELFSDEKGLLCFLYFALMLTITACGEDQNLKTVNFAGTMEQWNQAKEDTVEITTGITFEDSEETVVNKGITGDYGAFKVVCSDGEIDGKTLSGDGKNSDFNINFG